MLVRVAETVADDWPYAMDHLEVFWRYLAALLNYLDFLSIAV